MKYETELSVSYYGVIDSERDAQIDKIAEEHGFARAGSGAYTDGSQRDLSYTRDGLLTLDQRNALGTALTAAGNIDADLDVWDEDNEPVEDFALLTVH